MRVFSSLSLVVALLLAAPACHTPRESSPEPASGAGDASTDKPEAVETTLTIPEGATLPVALETSLSSSANTAGDAVVGTLVRDITSDGRVLAPAGSELRGHVTAAVSSGRVQGRARLAFAFDTLVVDGRPYHISARATDITAEKSTKQDAAIIGGSAVAGGIIGAIADGKGGAGKGALIGGAAGTGAVLATRGKQVSLPAGTQINVKLTEPASVG
jgi:hypothetical protein